ncbi:type III-A CRISPR-associated protein Csm2 [Fibrella arboris]|uniref:type III-A CRISPR-associated protein Csm2 n=1 Tax=Fibrella arboris TaxID=3242486 RepID=UPI003521210E
MAQTIEQMLDEGIKELDALQQMGIRLKETDVKTSQIRKFFGALKRIQVDFDNLKSEIILLEPRLAYAYGKAKGGDGGKEGLKHMYDTLGPLIKKIDINPEKFNRFVQITEAVVAYHKAEGGKE